MRTVLLPHDGSALGVRAAKAVCWLLGEEPFRVVVLHLTTPGEPEAKRDASLEETRRLLTARGAEVELKEMVGPIEGGILDGVARVRPDLIAMGSHGRRGLSRWTRGSVAEGVVHACPVPALVVTSRAPDPLPHERPHRILVPLDGTEEAARVLPLVQQLATWHGSTVLLARVAWDPTTRPVLATTLSRARLAETLDVWRERLTRAGVECETLGLHGDAAREIARVAGKEETDLIAMVTHGRGGLRRWFEGSTFDRVLRRAGLPLLVMRLVGVTSARVGDTLGTSHSSGGSSPAAMP